MVSVLDETDNKILAILKENGRASFADIARQVGLSEGAIRKRVKVLSDRRIIEKFTIDVSEATGQVRAIVMVKLAVNSSEQKLVDHIRTIAGVADVRAITGGYDVFVDIRSSSTKELYDKIASIRNQKGVTSTLTMTVLR